MAEVAGVGAASIWQGELGIPVRNMRGGQAIKMPEKPPSTLTQDRVSQRRWLALIGNRYNIAAKRDLIRHSG